MGMLMNTKGQVTVPADIRAEHGWRPGDEFEFVVIDGQVVLRAITDPRSRAEKVVRRMLGAGTANMDKTTDELMAMLRDD
ncbi:AbrB/MazE/SpoVT family DNA-binding domain-containing protein [Glycomyces sp. NPDC049804]|uniref:AbrB/MazE/SpoVT family DNA-binding domain-containing protein n=1 Tax=Glycomyces sp. NPDC049804 TaxID=3154363 RepID=UPI00342C0467